MVMRKYKVEQMSYPLDGVYRYNAQVWISVDGGENYYYCGIGKYCKTRAEAGRFCREYEEGHTGKVGDCHIERIER